MVHVSTCGAWLRLSLVRGVDTDKDEKERKGKTGKGKENIIMGESGAQGEEERVKRVRGREMRREEEAYE